MWPTFWVRRAACMPWSSHTDLVGTHTHTHHTYPPKSATPTHAIHLPHSPLTHTHPNPRSGRDLINMAKSRTNVIPIVEDARHPLKYRMLLGMVDCIFADVAQPDQARIVALNAQHFLKTGYVVYG
ncbi:hypothetical protein EON63_18780 [archaeon]|nr:MAG: hypothetical protein EON63_18780 [archaeon]